MIQSCGASSEMPVSAATLRLLMEVGVTGEALLRVTESIEKDNAQTVTPVTPNAARQARFRARQRALKALRNNVTSNVTASARARVDGSSSLTESTGKKKKEPAKRAIPVDAWKPPDELLEFATAQGFTLTRYGTELDKMRDWARGTGAVKKDWTAAARNWLRRVADELGLKPVNVANGAGMVEVFRTDERWDFLAARYEREHGRNLRHAQKWPFPQGWLEGNGSLAERQTG